MFCYTKNINVWQIVQNATSHVCCDLLEFFCPISLLSWYVIMWQWWRVGRDESCPLSAAWWRVAVQRRLGTLGYSAYSLQIPRIGTHIAAQDRPAGRATVSAGRQTPGCGAGNKNLPVNALTRKTLVRWNPEEIKTCILDAAADPRQMRGRREDRRLIHQAAAELFTAVTEPGKPC